MNTRLIGTAAIAMATAAVVAATPVTAVAGSSGGTFGPSNSTASVVVVPQAHARIAAALAPDLFPSPNSDVVGSVGFIDGEQAGHFWSSARGDSVSETFGGPAKIKKAILKLDVVSNNLSNGAHVDWTLSLDGIDVGSFEVVEGQRGPIKSTFRFPKITGGIYSVKIRVTNEVAAGQGSHTLRYDGEGPNAIILKRR